MKYLGATMIGKSYFLLSLLQAGLAQDWKHHTPREVTAQEGSCAQVPCHYSYPSHLANQPRIGIWNKEGESGTSLIAFHSNHHEKESQQFHHRTRLSGDLKNGNCSLIINTIKREDAGSYHFRIEFDKVNSYSYFPVTQIHISDFTDKPTIVPVEIIAGKRESLNCIFNTTCNGTAPALTWDTPTAVHGSVSNTVTQHGVTLTYTSALSLTPSRRHQGQTLTCRVSYPNVSSEQTLELTVQYPPQTLSIASLDGIKDSSINIIEGNSAVINCSVESFPASNLMWRHLNVTMNRTSSNNELWLKIPHITYRETGDYQCVAENKHGAVEGSITLTVEYSPRNLLITSIHVIKDSSINITEGNSAMIICSVESFPASNLTWRHLNVTMNRTSSNNELWLDIPHVTYRESGHYQCVAENEHGAMDGSITITVKLRDFSGWKAGLLGSGIILSVGLSGFFIFKCVKKGKSTGRGQTAYVSRDTPGEQWDRFRERRDMKQETKTKRCANEYEGPAYENCKMDWALRNQKKKFEEMKSNHNVHVHQEDDIYANCNFDEEAVYGNV
ncbi:sialic acid-binding Ig-like lectin 13 [Rhincodon typus]|uniref:sialic acid-binding Ig-like lectin 13 n=1 Tax=Rhincodon typus TaxID=259920 RepID=UPI00202EEAB3|nr:sialic acid-binding Ig-like lectin 13 [Rhincodon typus]